MCIGCATERAEEPGSLCFPWCGMDSITSLFLPQNKMGTPNSHSRSLDLRISFLLLQSLRTWTSSGMNSTIAIASLVFVLVELPVHDTFS